MEVRSQRGSKPTTHTVPRTLPTAASTLPSPRPEKRKRVAQSDFRLHSNCGPTVASRSVNLFLPKRPCGACLVVLSSTGCKVGRRIRQSGFLVGWYDLIFESADLRTLRSDARTGRCFLDKLSGVRDGSQMVECPGSETSLAAHSVRQPIVHTCNDLHPRPAKIGNSMGLDSPSVVSCLAHVTGLLARTTSSQSQHHL